MPEDPCHDHPKVEHLGYANRSENQHASISLHGTEKSMKFQDSVNNRKPKRVSTGCAKVLYNSRPTFTSLLAWQPVDMELYAQNVKLRPGRASM